jgi:hypothetical protein
MIDAAVREKLNSADVEIEFYTGYLDSKRESYNPAGCLVCRVD